MAVAPWAMRLISEPQAWDTVETAYHEGMKLFDTAPWYGHTKSEHRVGRYLRTQPRDSFTLSTKVGRIYFRPEDGKTINHPNRWLGGLNFDHRFDFTRKGIIRSYEDSLTRLGVNTVDMLVIHDLDLKHQKSQEGVDRAFGQLDSGGGMTYLKELKDRGEIKAIGAGINHMGMIPQFVKHFDIDFFLLAMPYTLLEQPALDEELPLCMEHGIGVVLGSVFASGILATGPIDNAVYSYKPAELELIERVRKMQMICQRHHVPMTAAALQFPLAHPAVNIIIPGANSPQQIHQNIEGLQLEIPDDLWLELKAEGLIRQEAPTPSA